MQRNDQQGGPEPQARTGVRPSVLVAAVGLIAAVAVIGYALRSEHPDGSDESAALEAQAAGENAARSGSAASEAPGAGFGVGRGAASGTGGDLAAGGDAEGAQASEARARGQAPGPGEPGRAEYIAAQRHARSVARDARNAASDGSPRSLEEARALLATPTASSEERIEAVDQLLDQGLEGEPDTPEVANVLESLREAALGSNVDVAIAAIEALGEIETPVSTQALGEILASNVSEDIKLAAIDAITSLDTAGAAVALSYGLRDASPDVRDEAAWGMSWVDDRDQSALSALVQAANVETDELIFDTMVSAIEDYE